MKTKILMIASVTGLALAAASHAGTYPTVAGWDFSQYQGPGVLSTDGSTFSSTLSANYSSQDTTFSAGSGAATFGTLYFDGTNGSSSVAASATTTAFVPTTGPNQAGSLESNQDGPANAFGDSDFDQFNVLSAEGQTFTNALAMTAASATDLVFEADLSSTSLLGGIWEVSFAGQTFGGTSSVDVEFSTDGSSYSLVDTVSLDETDQEFTVQLSTTDESATGYVRLSLDPSSAQPVIDNLSLDAITAVPEPGLALQLGFGMAGLLGLAARRRSA